MSGEPQGDAIIDGRFLCDFQDPKSPLTGGLARIDGRIVRVAGKTNPQKERYWVSGQPFSLGNSGPNQA